MKNLIELYIIYYLHKMNPAVYTPAPSTASMNSDSKNDK